MTAICGFRVSLRPIKRNVQIQYFTVINSVELKLNVNRLYIMRTRWVLQVPFDYESSPSLYQLLMPLIRTHY